jgi:hypothetical protein
MLEESGMRIVPSLFFTIAVVALAAYAELPALLGAHPWWAGKVVWYGAAPGFALALGLWWLHVPRVARFVLTVALLGVAFALASLGKTRFAASYAEDVFAGQLWFFGWIGVSAFATSAIISALTPGRDR